MAAHALALFGQSSRVRLEAGNASHHTHQLSKRKGMVPLGPVTASIIADGAGPAPKTVSVPGSTCVWPASACGSSGAARRGA